MRIAIGLVLAAVLAASASAQVPKGMGALGPDMQRQQQNDSQSSHRFNDGVKALQNKNYLAAEAIFRDFLRTNRSDPDANFLMGVTQMGLEDWAEAKTYLEVAVRKSPKKPDPKSRLGVTLIKLGDLEGAAVQRADLQKMSDKCKAKCLDAQWIGEGIAMMDAAMPIRPTAAAQ